MRSGCAIGRNASYPPELISSAQVFFAGSETWFDRSADLRVLLNGGVPKGVAGWVSGAGASAPAVRPGRAYGLMARANWLARDSNVTKGLRPQYEFNLDRNLEIFDFQSGIDFGRRDLLSAGDLIIIGVLGGVIDSYGALSSAALPAKDGHPPRVIDPNLHRLLGRCWQHLRYFDCAEGLAR